MSVNGTERNDFIDGASFIAATIDRESKVPPETAPFWVENLPTLDREAFPDDLALYELLDRNKPIAQRFRKATQNSGRPWLDGEIVNAILAANRLSFNGRVIRQDSEPIILRVGHIRALDIEHLLKLDGLRGKAFALKKLFG